MLINEPSLDQRIVDCLNTDYSLKVVTLTYLPLGADMNASVYKAETEKQLSYFVKLKRGQHEDLGLEILKLLQRAGIQQLIPPIKTIQGQQSQRLDDFNLIVYPFIDGQDGFSQTLTEEQWLILGATLRQIHEIEVPSTIQQRIRRETYSPKWRKIVRSLYVQIEAESSGDELALKLSSFMKEKKTLILQLVTRAEQLALKLQQEAHQFVLCHSDIHGGNVLMEGNKAIYLVDWDEPIMAPKERDLMFIGGGVANVWNKLDEEVLFYKGYGETKVNQAILTYYRCERIVEDIALYGQSLLLAMAEGEDRAKMYDQFMAMFEPKGVVDIALK